MKLIYKIPKTNNYQNIKEVLKAEFQMSDRLLLKLKRLQKIYLDGNKVYIHHSILPGNIITCDLNDEEDNSNIVPTNIPLDILYEDEAYLVINKPAGIPIHPSINHYTDSLSNGIRFYFDEIGLKKKIRPVNRLDKDTSGIVIFAKNEYVQETLAKQMQKNIFKKEYIAIVNGKLEKACGTISFPIAREENSIMKRCISECGVNAVTHYKVITYNSRMFKDLQNSKITKILEDTNYNLKITPKLESQKNFEIVHCLLETGRTHQIRLHFSAIGHPLLGDTLYGSASSLISRQALHAYQVTFLHPITKKNVSYMAPIPDDFNIFFS